MKWKSIAKALANIPFSLTQPEGVVVQYPMSSLAADNGWMKCRYRATTMLRKFREKQSQTSKQSGIGEACIKTDRLMSDIIISIDEYDKKNKFNKV